MYIAITVSDSLSLRSVCSQTFKTMLTGSVILLSLTFIISTRQTNIYLLPQTSQTVNQCPVERCYTFGDLQNHDNTLPGLPDYSISTAIVLLPGIHVNNETVLFSYATNFSLIVANSSVGATIQCYGSAGFTFEHAQGLLISGVEFRDCESFTQNSKVSIQIRYSLRISLSRAIKLRNITVKHGQSIGLAVTHVYGDFSIKGCRFLSSGLEYFSLYMYIEEREMQYTNITIVDSYFTGPADLQTLQSYGLMELKMAQEGSEYFVKMLVDNVVRDARVGDITFILCEIRCVYNLQGIFNFMQNTHTCEHTTSKMIKLSDAIFQDSRLSLYNEKVAASLMISNALFQNASLDKSCNFHLVLHNTIIRDGNFWSSGNMTVQGSFLYQRNTFDIELFTNQCNLIIDENTHMIIADNHMPHRDAPFTVFFATVLVLQNSTIIFKNNTGKMSGGLLLHSKSTMIFRGSSSITFDNNRGSRGGALALYRLSLLNFDGPCTLNFIQNRASFAGGAIFVEDDDYLLQTTPTLSVYNHFYEIINKTSNCHESEQVRFKFSDNTTTQAGSALYGGWISNNSCFRFEFDQPKKNDLSLIASNPTRVCICNEDSMPDCRIGQVTINVVPGQMFEIEAVTVGQRFGVVPSFVQAEFVGEGNGILERINRVQNTG